MHKDVRVWLEHLYFYTSIKIDCIKFISHLESEIWMLLSEEAEKASPSMSHSHCIDRDRLHHRHHHVYKGRGLLGFGVERVN